MEQTEKMTKFVVTINRDLFWGNIAISKTAGDILPSRDIHGEAGIDWRLL